MKRSIIGSKENCLIPREGARGCDIEALRIVSQDR